MLIDLLRSNPQLKTLRMFSQDKSIYWNTHVIRAAVDSLKNVETDHIIHMKNVK